MKNKVMKVIAIFIHIAVVYAIVILSERISSNAGVKLCPIEPMDVVLHYTIYLVAALSMICLYAKVIMKKTLSDIGIRRPFISKFWCVIAFALPVGISIFYVVFTKGELIPADMTRSEALNVFIRTVFLGVSTGVVEEAFSRGVVLRSSERVFGKKIAILFSSLLFACLHLWQVDAHDIYSVLLLLLGGTAVGIMFSLVSYQTGSIWPCAFMHGVWNMIIIGNVFSIKPIVESYNPCMYTYVLQENNLGVTGGQFGIECSVISIIGYSIVILIALKKMNAVTKN